MSFCSEIFSGFMVLSPAFGSTYYGLLLTLLIKIHMDQT